ncbi:MAG: glycoside hydrolase family 2 TIM barrel-domain containing protein [Thermoguttaceae bacterium]|jgi:beta-galactosidase
MRQLGFCLGLATALAWGAAARAADFVWLEGEKPSSSNYPKLDLGNWAGHAYLSAGKWLRIQVPAGDVEKAVPKEGIVLGYDFAAPSAGKYEVWNRIGFEFVRSPFSWRIDNGPWQEVQPSDPTIDLMLLTDWNEVAWYKCGLAELAAGEHRLEIRLQRWFKIVNNKKEEQQIFYCSDALCLSKGSFRPNGKFQPDAPYQDERDKAAAKQVFTMQSGAKGGERVETPLAGAWQIARWDELTVKEEDRTRPIDSVPGAERLLWYGIDVPGDRNEKRPEMAYCHRYVYRTRVDVPADLAGRAFFLHFGSTSLIASVIANGQLCGSSAAPFAIWDCDVTRALQPGKTNEILVAVKDAYYAATRPRELFNLPMSFFNYQGASMRFDFAVWSHMQNGIVEPVSLVAAGSVYASDVFAIPSLGKRQLGLEITLRNASAAAATVTIGNQCVPLEGGPAEKCFADRQVAVPAGQENVVKLAEGWENPKLWWPDAPQQYEVVTTVSLGGRVIDTRRTKFGFREWRWDHAQFTLNGVPYHGHADCYDVGTPEEILAQWKKHGQNTMRFWGTGWKGMNQAEALDFFDHGGVIVRRTGLLDGEGGNYGLTESVKIDGKDVTRARKALFDNWANQLKAAVRGERNHPSIMVWSIENEVTFINSRNWGLAQWVEPAIRDVAKQVMELDPTRPAMTDGGHAMMDQSMPINGVHYGESDLRDYPDEAYTCDKLFHQPQTIWKYDTGKPGFLGESLFTAGSPPSFYAGVQGESAFLGRSESAKGESLWVKMASEGYRWAGLGAAHFWMTDGTGGVYNSWQPVAVLCRQWNWTFASGSKVPRTLKVFNDTRFAEPIDVAWQLKIGPGIVAEGGKAFKVAPGMAEQFEITLDMPRVDKPRTTGQLLLTAGRGGKEVFRDVKPLVVIDPAGAARPRLAKQDLAVLDPSGGVKARLAARGIDFTEVAGFAGLPAKARVVLVGPNALTPEQSTSPQWLELAADGARVIVLEQDHPLHYQAIPADLEPTGYVGRVAFSENLDHPAFAGLGQEDFFTWSKDHVVYRNVYKKAAKGCRSLVQCEPELACSAMAECQVNDGLVILCQLVVGEKLAFDPVAQRLFDNTLNYAAGYQVSRKQTAVVAEARSPWAKMLAASGLKYDLAGDAAAALADGKHTIVVVQATPAALRTLAARRDVLRAFTERGGYLMLCGLTPEGLADFNKLVGFEHAIRPFEMERVTLATPNDPLMAGLTTRDVVMESGQQIVQWSGDRFMASDVFSYVVDLNDIAPFCKIPGPEYFKNPGAGPGWDHWPRNMVNGFTSADSWKYCFTIAYGKGEPLAWTFDLPKEEEIIELDIIPTPIFNRIEKVKLSFDGGPPVSLELRNVPGRQDVAVPPHKARRLTMEIVPVEGKQQLVGVDNLWIRVTRPADFSRRVRPMLNIGAMVRYPMGRGGVILNNLLVPEKESVPVNAQKKQNIVSTILRNLGATFAGGRIVTAAQMRFRPVPFNEQANAYLTKGHGTFPDVDLSTLPVGEQKLAGVTYKLNDFRTSPVPSCVMLRGPGVDGRLPAEATIKVGRKADALFFLQGYIQAQEWKPNDPNQPPPVVFKYVVRYADGQAEEVPVEITRGIAPYTATSLANLKNAVVAWTGKAATPQAQPLVVYQLQWSNPRPQAEIKSVALARDPQAGENWGAPVWIGLTSGSLK